uniref:NAD(P)-binding domain-containing protein n=1 Tax=Pseudictyota dubia TaxID=2749911 RepID=A0A7R9VGH1_9STRA|mmetsp:Transcript_14088/g.26613  ORF Transcript_14088/g.26613 Transcript_14088/m.26613 type:complete len:228 (+) Transcript_14088:365-1048(+)
MTDSSPLSVLIIGASGRTGLEILRQLSQDTKKKEVHAMCRDPSKIPEQYKENCESVIKGDARSPDDIEQAINDTNAQVVIVSVGNGDSVAKSDVRTASARALARVMEKPQYRHVRALVVSSTGAGTSKIKVGMGVGKIISYHLRHVLKDHTGQEKAFGPVSDRTVIVRATALTDNKATGNVKEFGDKEKSPTIKIDRADLAEWVVKEVCAGGTVGGKVVNITGIKAQ